jgi:tripartite-type tricarboxylate transporter receptor subunit TctC
MTLRRVLPAVGAGFLLFVSISASFAQLWPSRPVKVIVPYAPGITDTTARLTAERLGKRFNQPFPVENKIGANGAVGVDSVMQSPADGTTVLFAGSGIFTVLPLVQNVSFEPLKDLVPVSITGSNGMVLVADRTTPYSTLRQLIDFARDNPGKIRMAHSGIGTNNHLAAAYLTALEGLNVAYVQFGGGGQAPLTGLLAKQADLYFGNTSDVMEAIKAGKVKPIAVSTRQRMPQVANVPTAAETIPGFEYLAWNAYAVPRTMPPAVVTRLAFELQVIARDPELVRAFADLGIDMVGSTPEEAAARTRKEMEISAAIIDISGLRKK